MDLESIPHVKGVHVEAGDDGTGEVDGIVVIQTDLQTDPLEPDFDANARADLDKAVKSRVPGRYRIERA